MNLRPYKEIGNFRFWCQKTLPLVYDDSLSYYELLCKVVNYLNDVIDNSQVMEENIANLAIAYDELQNFVNTYFDNLDVQEEINNKLDAMAQDGTLTLLIGGYVTPQMFGAKADGVTDDTQPIQYCLDNYDNVYIPKGNYLITGLHIDGAYKKFVCDGNIISNSYLIKVNSSYSIVSLNGNNKCKGDGIILDLNQNASDEDFNIQFNYISAKNIRFNENGLDSSAIYINANTDFYNGIYCNEFHVDRIISASNLNGNGIGIYQSGNCYVTENTFNKSSIMRCGNAIMMNASQSLGFYSMNGNLFDGINPETSNVAISIIGNVSLSKFENFRTLEFASNTFISIDGEATGNKFSVLQPLRVSSISVKNNNRQNVITGEIHDRSGNVIYETSEVLLKGNGGSKTTSFTLIQTLKTPNKIVYINSDTTLSKTDATSRYINNNSVFTTGGSVTSSPVLTLSDDFGYGYIDKIRVYAPANKPVIKVKDATGNVLLDKNICDITYMYTIEWVGNGLVTVECAISDTGTDNANNPKHSVRKLEFTADAAPTTDDALISLLNENNTLISYGSTIIDVYNGLFCYATMFVTKVNNNAAICKVISYYSTNDKTYRYSSGSWHL